MMDPNGYKAHYITKGMFRRLCNLCEHKYLPEIPDKDVAAFCEQVEHLTAEQLSTVVKAIEEHPMYDDLREC
jgi:hypothetical protein